jgi:hypothetical protein
MSGFQQTENDIKKDTPTAFYNVNHNSGGGVQTNSGEEEDSLPIKFRYRIFFCFYFLPYASYI